MSKEALEAVKRWEETYGDLEDGLDLFTKAHIETIKQALEAQGEVDLDLNALAFQIGGMLDLPNVYMGGVSRHNKQRAAEIIKHLHTKGYLNTSRGKQ